MNGSNGTEWYSRERTTIPKRVLLENFLDERMLSKLKTVTDKTPIRGAGRLLEKLASHYIDNKPMIIRRHAFTSCKQDWGEPFMA